MPRTWTSLQRTSSSTLALQAPALAASAAFADPASTRASERSTGPKNRLPRTGRKPNGTSDAIMQWYAMKRTTETKNRKNWSKKERVQQRKEGMKKRKKEDRLGNRSKKEGKERKQGKERHLLYQCIFFDPYSFCLFCLWSPSHCRGRSVDAGHVWCFSQEASNSCDRIGPRAKKMFFKQLWGW